MSPAKEKQNLRITIFGISAIVAIFAIVFISFYLSDARFNYQNKQNSPILQAASFSDEEKNIVGGASRAFTSSQPQTNSPSNQNPQTSQIVPVDQLLEQKSNSLSPMRSLQVIVRGNNNEQIIVGAGQGINSQLNMQTLPNSIAQNAVAEKFDGYIVKLKDKSIAEKFNELDKRVGTAKTQNILELKKHRADLLSKQEAEIKSLKSLIPNLKIKRKFITAFNGFHANLTQQEAQKLRSKGYKVWQNMQVKAVLMDSVPLINADDVWKLDSDLNPCETTGKDCLTGKGVKIAIIDTGVDYTHKDLGGCFGQNCKVEGGFDIINNDNDPVDDMGHGTHVASIAAGNGVLKGVAPDADIFAYKVLDAGGYGTWESVIAGIERAIDPNQDGDFSDKADIISMSLGGFGDPDDPPSQAVDNAVNVGTVAVIAAGNSGPDGNPYCRHEGSGNEQSICSPGTAREAITVGATYKSDTIASFSSRGPVIWEDKSIIKPDVVAPGVSICAAEYDDAWLDRKCLDDKHISISGTSMATPHVAGAAALLKQKNPTWDAQYIKSALKNTAKDIEASAIERGTGRIDALATVSQNLPPVAVLEPIPTNIIAIPIRGKIDTTDLKEWSLAYASFNPSVPEKEWVELMRSSNKPTTSELYTLDAKKLPDGEYIIKLEVNDLDGQKAIDYGYLKVDKVDFAELLNYDIYRGGDKVPVKLIINPVIVPQEIILEYGIGQEPKEWIRIPNANFWDTRDISTGWYTLRATVMHDGIQGQEQVEVYLDTTLKKGWPVRVPWSQCREGGNCYWWAGFIEPVISDIDGDGKEEIMVLTGGDPPKLYVYKNDGSLFWSSNIGTIYMPGGNTHIPLALDVDNDNKKEIFTFSFGSLDYTFSELYSFTFDGRLRPGWPKKIPYNNQPTMLAADLNHDGIQEIIVKGDGGFPNNIMLILDGYGNIKSQWNLTHECWSSLIRPIPAVGNFDEDNDLEIVVTKPSESSCQGTVEGELYIFNWNGTPLPGWPIMLDGISFSSPAVGDLNKDGKDEIVINLRHGSGGLYVYDNKGKVLPGWPVGKDTFYSSSPSLGDLDGDGDLEIAASRLGFVTEVYHHDGQLAKGWPQLTSWDDYYSTIIGDVNGDNVPDVITTAGALPYGNGGVYAWTSQGNLVLGFPKGTEVQADAPAVISSIDKDGKVDIIASSDWDYDGIKNVYKHRSSIYVWETNSNLNQQTMHWPTFHHDVQRTGLYESPIQKLSDLTIPQASITKEKIGYSYKALVSNIGTKDSGQYIFQVKEQNLPARAKPLSSLKAGESKIVHGKIAKLPVAFTVDPKNLIKELNESNNNLTVTKIINVNLPSLKLENGP